MAYKPKKAPVAKAVKSKGKMLGKGPSNVGHYTKLLQNDPGPQRVGDVAKSTVTNIRRGDPKAALKPSLNLAAPPEKRYNKTERPILKQEGKGISGHNGSFKFKVMGNRKGYKAGE